MSDDGSYDRHSDHGGSGAAFSGHKNQMSYVEDNGGEPLHVMVADGDGPQNRVDDAGSDTSEQPVVSTSSETEWRRKFGERQMQFLECSDTEFLFKISFYVPLGMAVVPGMIRASKFARNWALRLAMVNDLWNINDLSERLKAFGRGNRGALKFHTWKGLYTHDDEGRQLAVRSIRRDVARQRDEFLLTQSPTRRQWLELHKDRVMDLYTRYRAKMGQEHDMDAFYQTAHDALLNAHDDPKHLYDLEDLLERLGVDPYDDYVAMARRLVDIPKEEWEELGTTDRASVGARPHLRRQLCGICTGDRCDCSMPGSAERQAYVLGLTSRQWMSQHSQATHRAMLTRLGYPSMGAMQCTQTLLFYCQHDVQQLEELLASVEPPVNLEEDLKHMQGWAMGPESLLSQE